MTTGSSERKTVAVMRGRMILCAFCYESVQDEKLVDEKNYVEDHEAFFDLICPGCEDLNRPLIDDVSSLDPLKAVTACSRRLPGSGECFFLAVTGFLN
jgi:hypothetical protein